MMRTTNPINYTFLMQIPTFEERVKALFLHGKVGELSGSDRIFMQDFYHSREWKDISNPIRIRDNGKDLGCFDRDIKGQIIIHHIEPITINDIIQFNSKVWDPENLISVSDLTHKAIHYGDMRFIITRTIPERKPNDTIPWR